MRFKCFLPLGNTINILIMNAKKKKIKISLNSDIQSLAKIAPFLAFKVKILQEIKHDKCCIEKGHILYHGSEIRLSP